MKTLLLTALLATTAIAVSACGNTRGERALSGAGIGAATGAVAGAATGGSVGGGALLGGAVGAGVGAVTTEDQVDFD
tara:strand:+ start:3526 stop:3756 length:231 start_codon:yes stop_codon:yes gene_type:complete